MRLFLAAFGVSLFAQCVLASTEEAALKAVAGVYTVVNDSSGGKPKSRFVIQYTPATDSSAGAQSYDRASLVVAAMFVPFGPETYICETYTLKKSELVEILTCQEQGHQITVLRGNQGSRIRFTPKDAAERLELNNSEGVFVSVRAIATGQQAIFPVTFRAFNSKE
jgi:hypothetical protein